jgi:hypothetical protein
LKKGGFAFFFFVYLGLGVYSNNSFVAYLGSKIDKLIIPGFRKGSFAAEVFLEVSGSFFE